MSIFKTLGYILGNRKGKPMGNNQSKRIATAVTEFVNNHTNREFTAQELRQYVLGHVVGDTPVAPASADRIMRQLRQSGTINYVLVSRIHSLYKGLTSAFDREKAPEQWVNPPHDTKYGETVN